MDVRISPSAQRILAHVFGSDAVSDLTLKSNELARAPHAEAILAAVGVEDGAQLTDEHAWLLVARATATGGLAERTGRPPSLQPRAINRSADSLLAAGRDLAAAGQHEAATSALGAATVLYQQLTALHRGSRSRQRQAVVEALGKAQVALLDLVEPPGDADILMAYHAQTLRRHGWTDADLARVLLPAVRDGADLAGLRRVLSAAGNCVAPLRALRLDGAETLIRLATSARPVLEQTGMPAAWSNAIELRSSQAHGLANTLGPEADGAEALFRIADQLMLADPNGVFAEQPWATAALVATLKGRSATEIQSLADRTGGSLADVHLGAAFVAAGVTDFDEVGDLVRAVNAAGAQSVRAADLVALIAELRDAGVTAPDATQAFLSRLLANGWDNAEEAVSMVTGVLAAGKVTPDQALPIAQRLRQAVPSWTRPAGVEAYAELVRSGSPSEALAVVGATLSRNTDLGEHESLEAIRVIARRGADAGTDLATIERAATFVIDYGTDAQANDVAWAFADALDRIGVDLADCTYERFASAFAAGVNAYVEANGPGDQELMATVGVLLNAIHDRDHAINGHDYGDRLRETATSEVSAKAAYAIIAAGADSLYSSSYKKLRDAFRRKVPDAALSAFLRSADPEQRATLAFLHSLEGFNQTDMIVAAHDVFMPFVIDGLGIYYGSLEDLGRAAPFVIRVYDDTSPEQKAALEAAILAAIQGSEAGLGYRAGAAYLLRSLSDQGKALTKGLAAVAADLSPIPSVEPKIDAWLQDGVVTAKLFTRSDGTPSRRWLWGKFAYYQTQGFAADHEYMSELRAQGADMEKTIAMVREHAGIKQRIIATYDPDDDARKVSHDVDIVVNRTHSFDLEEVYRTEGDIAWDHPMLLVGGSCWSFRDMTEDDFLRTYGEHQILAQTAVAGSWTNNRVLMRVMNGIAEGKRRWDQYRLGPFMKDTDGLGYRPVDHPALLIGSYVKPFTEWLERIRRPVASAESTGALDGAAPHDRPATPGPG
jgi:hypothetical protein